MSDLALDLSLAGTQLIEASAGTGKTYTIAGLYLRLIVERRFEVRQILVVTFTTAATEELKDRLRRRLNVVADIAEAMSRHSESNDALRVDSEAQFAIALIERELNKGDESAREIAQRLRLAAVSMDEAAISTIHGFCQRVLREQAFPSGEPLDAGELIGSDRDLYEQIVGDYWRSLASDPVRADDFDVLANECKDADQLARLLPQLCAPDVLIYPQPAADGGADDLAVAVQQLLGAKINLLRGWSASGAVDIDVIVEYANSGILHQGSYKEERQRGFIAVCVAAFARDELPDREILEYFSAAVLGKRTRKAGPALPALGFPQAVDQWLAAVDALTITQAQRWPHLLHEMISKVRAQLTERKARAARVSYDDLIGRLHAAITSTDNGEHLASALRARYPVALVDEFQDTDARQFEIFKRIYRDAGSLFLVGDPKQAIYRFRGGDIEAYLRAAEGADTKECLDRNFRSSPGLLAAIETLFTTRGEQAFLDPRICFEPVAAGGRAHDDDVLIDGAPIAPMTAWHLPDHELDATPNKDDGREQLAAGCAEAIVQLLGKARTGDATIARAGVRIALTEHNIAVLVSTNNEAGVMQEALARRGVASATIRQASVFSTDEAGELLILLRALHDGRDGELRAALATRLLGCGAAEIAELGDDTQPARWLAQQRQFESWRDTWREHGTLALCERVFAQRAAGILASKDGERRMTNLLQLAELLQAAGSQTFGEQGLIDWLVDRIDQADDHNEEEQLRLESDAERVQIATIHASKGLEYDLVFLPFTALRPGQRNQMPRLVDFHENGQRAAWVISAASKELDSPALSNAKAQADREQLGERVRVLYVALTRARHACWFSWDAIGKHGELPALAHLLHGEDGNPDSAAMRAQLDELATRSHGTIAVQPLPAAGDDRLVAVEEAELHPARVFRGHIDSGWWMHSFSQLRDERRDDSDDVSGADDEIDAAEPAAPAPAGANDAIDLTRPIGESASASVPTWPSGAEFGTALHEILEHTDFAEWRGHDGSVPPDSQRAIVVSILRRHALASTERSRELLRVVTAFVTATLNVRLPDDLRLADLAPSQRRSELPFHFAMGNADPVHLLVLLHEYGYQRRRSDFARLHGRLFGLMTGVIDLVYRHAGRWWLIDYKSNHLGSQLADYTPAALKRAVHEDEYDLQYLIYSVALHRWLRQRLGSAYDYERDFGGACYLFVRGLREDASHGVHLDRPPFTLIDALDRLLAPAIAASDTMEQVHG